MTTNAFIKRKIEHPSVKQLQLAGYAYKEGKWQKEGLTWEGEAIESYGQEVPYMERAMARPEIQREAYKALEAPAPPLQPTPPARAENEVGLVTETGEEVSGYIQSSGEVWNADNLLVGFIDSSTGDFRPATIEERLPEGWTYEETDTGIAYIDPQGWKITPEGNYIDPQGNSYTEAQIVESEELMAQLGDMFPETDVQELTAWAEDDPERFVKEFQDAGDTPETRAVLKRMGVSDEDINDIYPERKWYTGIVEKVPEPVWEGLGWISEKIEPIERAWLGTVMGTGVILSRVAGKETQAGRQIDALLTQAYEKHGWKMMFADEIREAWEVADPSWAKTGLEWMNPVWFIPAGGIAGRVAQVFTKVPALGKTLAGVAKSVQAAERVAGLPLELPLRGLGKAGRLIIHKLPSPKDLDAALFPQDKFRAVAKHIPGMKKVAPATVIGETPEVLVAKADIQDAISREVFKRTTILEQGQSVKGQALANLRELGRTKEILGVEDAMCNPKRVRPKPEFPDASLALGDVVQAPERYIFSHKSGYEYCKRAQQMSKEMYELAIQEGVDVNLVGLEPFEEYIHWVCEGKIGKDGILEISRRGSRSVGGIVSSMKHRRFESMAEGIKAGYKYGDDLETYVSSYYDDMFKSISDKRFGAGVDDVISRVPEALPTTAVERLGLIYPERAKAWESVSKEMGDLGYAWSAVKRLGRGEKLPSATIEALARRSPTVVDDLGRITGLSSAERPKAIAALSKKLKTQIEGLRPEWWKAKAGRAEAMEIVRKPILGRGEGMIVTGAGRPHPMFANQIYPADIAEQASKLLNEEVNGFLNVTAQISGGFRLQQAALDLSAGLIQGFMAHGSHPVEALKGQLFAINALRNPKTFQAYLIRNAASINERIYYLGAQRPFEYFEQMGLLQKLMGKAPGGKFVLGQTYGRAEAAFSMWSTVYKDMMWQGQSKKWIRAGQGAEFARYLDRMTGMMSFNQLGTPKNLTAFLKGFVSFAPQYRMSVLSYFADVFKGGMTGNAVRADIAKTVAAGTIAYYAFCEATGRPAYLNPLEDGKKFMSINIDGHWIGLGSAVISMLRASMDITASALSIGMNEPGDFRDWDKWSNPLIRALYSQSAPLTQIVTDLATQKTFMGFPLETVEDWANWVGEQFSPIAVQDVLFDRSGVPWSPLALLGELFGLRTSPQTRWESLDGKIRELDAWKAVTDLTDEQREKIEAGEPVLQVLDEFQERELLNAFPELTDFYEEAVADALLRSSDTYKNFERSTSQIREEATSFLDKSAGVVKSGDEDTRWLRGRYSEIMQTYADKNDIIREVEEYQSMFEEWEASREKKKPDAELVDLAYWEYIEKVASQDFETEEGEYDYESHRAALMEWRERWGEDMYGKIRYILEDNKADFPPWIVKLWKDRENLNESGYWDLPQKPIYQLDEEDVPREYLSLWREYQAAGTREQCQALLEANPEFAKDWRVEWRLSHPEQDAALGLWTYGGKIQTREAYDLAKKSAEELGFPLSQIGGQAGLPPEQLLDNYFDFNKIVGDYGGTSAEAQLYKLENADWFEWGKQAENYGWLDVETPVQSLRISVKWGELDGQYNSYAERDSDNYMSTEEGRREARESLLQSNQEYAKDRRRRDAYGIGFPEPLIADYVAWFMDYSKKPDDVEGTWYEDDWFLMENKDFYNKMVNMGIWQARDFSKVPTRQWWTQYNQYYLALPEGRERYEFRGKMPSFDVEGVRLGKWKPYDPDRYD